MADEKQTPSEIDDWLEDLDDSEDFSGELDQDNIDALLGEGQAAGESEPEEASDAEDQGMDELDQDNIDALLGNMISGSGQESGQDEGTEEDESQELDQANIDFLLGGGNKDTEEEKAADDVDLDQDNIDALLGGSDEGGEPAGAEAGAELDQDNIDALLGGSDEGDEPAGAEAGAELDQDNIDALLGGSDEGDEPAGEETGAELDQDNIDALLGGAEEVEASDTLFGGETEDGADLEGLDVDQDEIDQLFSGLDEDDDVFDTDDMDLADVLESDEDEFIELGSEGESADVTAGTAAASGDATVATAAAEEYEEEEKTKAAGILPFLPVAIDRTVASIIALCLVLFIGVGIYFFVGGEEEEQAIPLEGMEQLAQMEKTLENSIPIAADAGYEMPAAGGEVAIHLAGQDQDGDALVFQVTSPPQHGRLSGEAPALTYLPNTDFPGQDSFEYSVSDGQDTSPLATVNISGPNLVQLAADKEEKEKEEKSFKPTKPVVLARNITYKTVSTDGVTINWAKIWRQANHSAFSSKVYVDVDSSNLSGRMVKINPAEYRYQPDPFFHGKEVISYRFKRGGLSSGTARLTMDVTLGSPAPEIRVSGIDRGYQVGEMVRIDASATRDEAREKLRFSWEQVAGVPVYIEQTNEEGSVISFAMPSTFHADPQPGPVLRLTAVDETGKSDVMDMKVLAISRRQAALWRGVRGGVAEDPPLRGSALPWPYDD